MKEIIASPESHLPQSISYYIFRNRPRSSPKSLNLQPHTFLPIFMRRIFSTSISPRKYLSASDEQNNFHANIAFAKSNEGNFHLSYFRRFSNKTFIENPFSASRGGLSISMVRLHRSRAALSTFQLHFPFSIGRLMCIFAVKIADRK